MTRRTLLAIAAATTGLSLISTQVFPVAAQADSNETITEGAKMDFNPKTSALLFLHYQTDIISIFASAGIDDYVERLSALAARARSHGMPVIFVKIGFSADYREISPRNKNGQMIKSFGLFTDDTVPPAMFVDGDIVLIGHRAGGFSGTSLDQQLKSFGVDTILMAGATTTGTVLSTLSEASDLDYRILLIEDGCFEPDQAAHVALFANPFATRADIVSTADLLAQL